MNLSELIDLHRGSRSYADLERDCGGAPSKGRLQQLVRQPIKNFPDPPTCRALARGLRVPQSAVVLAAAESLGLDVRRSQPRLVELLPSGAEDLSELQAAAIAHLVATIVDPGADQGASTPVPGPEPILDNVMRLQRQSEAGSGATGKREEEPVREQAAREGTPRLRGVRKAQDEAGEAPDPAGPEEGS